MEPAIEEMHGGDAENDNTFRLHNAGNDTFWICIIVIRLLEKHFPGASLFAKDIEFFKDFKDYGDAYPGQVPLKLASASGDVAVIVNDT